MTTNDQARTAASTVAPGRLEPSDLVLAERFPPGFLWGAATSSYQVEGGVSEHGRGPSIWDSFSHTPGKTVHGDTGDIACDHVHRWREDVALMRDLGLGAYRLSLSWARLQPSGRGALNASGLAFYRDLLEALRTAGIEPLVTLYHWDMPQVLEDEGGWPARDVATRFADFAGQAVEALGDLADAWITLNEPWCQAFLGYGYGVHAPGRTDISAAVAAAHHLNVAHGLAVRSIRAARPEARVGIADILTDVVAVSDHPDDVSAARRYEANGNRLFLDPVLLGRYPDDIRELYAPYGLDALLHPGDEALIAAPLDFLAVNHYHRVVVRADPSDPHLGAQATPGQPASTSLGWSVTPDALRDVLLRVQRDYPPIPLLVTENGASYADYVDPDGNVKDPERVAYLRGYLGAVADAIAAGVDLRGYFVWSLMDNFEWGEGYRSRFGLVYVDYGTQRRIPKSSAAWYRDLIARHRRTAGAAGSADRDGRPALVASPE